MFFLPPKGILETEKLDWCLFDPWIRDKHPRSATLCTLIRKYKYLCRANMLIQVEVLEHCTALICQFLSYLVVKSVQRLVGASVVEDSHVVQVLQPRVVPTAEGFLNLLQRLRGRKINLHGDRVGIHISSSAEG